MPISHTVGIGYARTHAERNTVMRTPLLMSVTPPPPERTF